MDQTLPSLIVALLVAACGAPASEPEPDAGPTGDAGGWSTYEGPSPFAGAVVSFTPGEGAGFGGDEMPNVVLGPPDGHGNEAGSLDVVSLGRGGEVVLELTEVDVVDGEGPDLLVFENTFRGFTELASVAVSLDGSAWAGWTCDTAGEAHAGCAGMRPVHLNAGNFSVPLDPDTAGGDAFDLADVGLARIRFVKVTDTGTNGYAGTSGGFDLDAVGGIHVEPRAP